MSDFAMAVDFYFDFSSPYSYIASEKIDALAESYQLSVNWKPFLLGAVMKTTGGTLLVTGHSSKVSYALEDFVRSASLAKVPFQFPLQFPQASVTACRCAAWVHQHVGAIFAKAFSKEVMRELFVRGGDINNFQTLQAIAIKVGIDGAAMLAGYQESDIKGAVMAQTTEAVDAQVFGAPTFVFNGERFWGFDRLWQLESRIKEKLGGKGYQTMIHQALAAVTTLSVDEAHALHKRAALPSGAGEIVFVDLRDPRELEKAGVIPGAFHAPRGMLEFWVDPKSPYYKAIFNPSKQFVFFCAGGWRSALAAHTVAQMGLLPNLAHIDGGFDAWKKAGAPTVTKPIPEVIK